MNKDFNNLQVGDTVAISNGGLRILATVFRSAKGYIATRWANGDTGWVFSRKTGLIARWNLVEGTGSGDKWNTISLFVPTEQEIEEITQEQNQRRLRITAAFALQQTKDRIQQLSEDELRSIIDALNPYYKKPDKI